MIHNEDCLEGMKKISDGSVDMILTDLPYGTTDCSFDKQLPFAPMWEQFLRPLRQQGRRDLSPFRTESRRKCPALTSKMSLYYNCLFRRENIWQSNLRGSEENPG